MCAGQSTGVINNSLIYNLLTQHDDCWMNMNSCLATRTLDRFVHKSNTALLLTQRVDSVSATINYTYLRSDTAAQKRNEVWEKNQTVSTTQCLHNVMVHFISCVITVIINIWYVSIKNNAGFDSSAVEKNQLVTIALWSLRRHHMRMKGDCNHDYLSMDLCSQMTRM